MKKPPGRSGSIIYGEQAYGQTGNYFLMALLALSTALSILDLAVSAAALMVESTFIAVESAAALTESVALEMAESARDAASPFPLQAAREAATTSMVINFFIRGYICCAKL